jgi:hypothetical protein
LLEGSRFLLVRTATYFPTQERLDIVSNRGGFSPASRATARR